MADRPIKPTIPQQVPQHQGGQPAAPNRPQTVRQPPVGGGSTSVQSGEQRLDNGELAVPVQPSARPPMGFLTILDDGSEEGETIRLRADSTLIGRTTGNIVIPHDSMMSSTHAAVERRYIDGAHQWFIKDLESTNRTFVKVSKVTLRNGLVLILGSYHYVFRSMVEPNNAAQAEVAPKGTRGWQAVGAQEQKPASIALVRIRANGTEQPFPIWDDTAVVGQDIGSCTIVISDDPAISTTHARLHRSDTGELVIEDLKSLNGLWMAVKERRLGKDSHFQLGEQRFRFRTTP